MGCGASKSAAAMVSSPQAAAEASANAAADQGLDLGAIFEQLQLGRQLECTGRKQEAESIYRRVSAVYHHKDGGTIHSTVVSGCVCIIACVK